MATEVIMLHDDTQSKERLLASGIADRALTAIKYVQEEENNLECARAMRIGRYFSRIELPEPNLADNDLQITVERINKPEAPHIDEPSIVFEWESFGTIGHPRRERVAVAVARLIGDEIELQNGFVMSDYEAILDMIPPSSNA